MPGVRWRNVFAVLIGVLVALSAVIVVLRADGFPAVEATVPRATRWFVHQASSRVVLADGFSGKALARLDVDADGDVLDVAQSASGVALLDRSAGTARPIDASALRLGSPQSVRLLSEPSAVVGVGQTGLVTVDPSSGQAMLVPSGGGEPVAFDVPPTAIGNTRVAPDGGVWTLGDGTLSRVTSTTEESVLTDLDDARFELVGNLPFVIDEADGRARFRNGDWVDLPDDIEMSELVMQSTGPRTECGWIGVDDRLWCIDEQGIEDELVIDGLDIDGADLLAVAGDAAALVRRSPSEIVRIDVRAGELLDDVVASVPAGQPLTVSVSVDLIWVDQPGGALAWAIHPWGINAISKNDNSTPLLGESGEVLEAGSSTRASTSATPDELVPAAERQADNNGIDDPPVAVDDPVTARTGAAVPVVVTANDYDPDGEAVVVSDVGAPARGTAEIISASTIVYRPESGYVGLDRFEYTIVDGDGTPATATVAFELLPVDATNRGPVGTPDQTETGPGRSVIIDVLLNDIDPERDPLLLHSFDASADLGGVVTETVAPSGLPGLRFEPPPSVSGTATFTYRPADSFGAVGEPVVVRVEIAQASDENRPPITQPDAVRLRRDIPTPLPVLANDRDPDGDPLQLGLVEPLPPGLEVTINGEELIVTARAGAPELVPFSYTVDDGSGPVTGRVLVSVIGSAEPNRPPAANADLATAVAGRTQTIDVLLNDTDPDGDPLILVSVERGASSTAGAVSVQGNVVQYTAPTVVSDDEEVFDRFTYVVSDGNGHSVEGDVTVRVLPEQIAAPPFAKDDSATTQMNTPVTLDVLRNDGDPSGERPTLVGAPGCLGFGTAVVTADERVTYHPPADQTGVFRCTYEVTNSVGLRASAAIIVNVVAPAVTNQPPVVVNEEYVVTVGQTVTIDVLANDSDPDGPNRELRVVSSSTPTIGTAVRNAGLITFTAGTVTGEATITYQVGDARGGLTTGYLFIRVVAPVPQAPVTAPDRRTIRGPGVATTIDVLANDTDPDGAHSGLLVTSASLVSGAGTVQSGARNVTFVPDPAFVGDMVATYTVQDTSGLTATGQVTLTVLEPLNRPPVARDDAGEVVNGGSTTVPIALNDEDPDGDPLTYTITSGPDSALGSARLTGAGGLAFDAVPGASGQAVIGYRIDDGRGESATATVRINVLPCAVAPPEAPDLFFQTGYMQAIGIDLTAHARNGDIVEVGPPLGVAAGVYTPPAGENGNVTFNYVVRNACRIQRVGTVVIDVNQDPVGSAYSARIGRIDPVSIPVTALASDGPGEPLVISGLEGAPAWVTVPDPQTLRVNPAGRSGTVSFVAIVADPGGLTARVPVSLELINLAPTAHPDTYDSANAPIVLTPLANDVDPDGDALSLAAVPSSVTFPNGVTRPIERTGDQLRIDPGTGSGTVTFEYTAVDALGLVSAPATITVRVNRPPTASDVSVNVPAGTSVQVTVPASDPDGNPLTLTLGTPPVGLTVSVSGMVVTVTAAADAEGLTADIPYTVSDASASASAKLSVAVVAPTTTTTTTTTSTTTTTTTSTTQPPAAPGG